MSVTKHAWPEMLTLRGDAFSDTVPEHLQPKKLVLDFSRVNEDADEECSLSWLRSAQ